MPLETPKHRTGAPMDSDPTVDSSTDTSADPYENFVVNTRLDEMLNTPGFTEFLAKYPEDAMNSVDDQALLEKRFEVFQLKDVLKKDAVAVCTEHYKNNMGLELSATDTAGIDAYIENEAIANPDSILEINATFRQLRQIPKEIASLEDELAQLGGAEKWQAELADQEAKKKAIQTVKDNAFTLNGIANMLFDRDAAVDTWRAARSIKRNGGSLHIGDLNTQQTLIDERIQQIRTAISNINISERMSVLLKRQYDGLRGDILRSVTAQSEVAKILRTKVKEEMDALIARHDYDSLQIRFEEFQKISLHDVSNVNLLKGVDISEIQTKIDRAIEEASLQGMIRDIQGMKFGDNNLTRMEQALEFFLKKKKMGSKEGDEVRKFLGETIDKAQKSLTDSVQDKAKKILLVRIKIKYKL